MASTTSGSKRIASLKIGSSVKKRSKTRISEFVKQQTDWYVDPQDFEMLIEDFYHTH